MDTVTYALLDKKKQDKLTAGADIVIGTDGTISVDRALLEYDEDAGEYRNIDRWFERRRDAKIFTTKIPKYSTSTSPACTKMDDNAGLTVDPSTNSTAGRDDYHGLNAFACIRCNGYVDADGMPHVTAIEGDGRFAKDGSNGDVFILTPNLYWRWVDLGGYSYISICDSPMAGFEQQPGGFLPDGTKRPFMLYAAYPGGRLDGKLVSVSGAPAWTFWTNCGFTGMSHNSSHSIASARGAGYSGKTQVDSWYAIAMMLVKYATKSIQTVYQGCTQYNIQKPCAAASTGDYVVMTATNAASYLVGSSVCVGKMTSAGDRNNANAHDVVGIARILSKETLESGNVALHLDAGDFESAAGNYVSTMPYHAGYCDDIMGTDGYPTVNDGREPCRIQNIEGIMSGCYEVLSDTILVGSPEQKWYVCRDSAKYSTALTADYELVGSYAGTAAAWNYGMDIVNAGGVLMPSGDQESSGLGAGDGYYLPGASSSSYECRSVGCLSYGAYAGLSCVLGSGGLGFASWSFGSRLSPNGRTGVSAA